MLVAAYEKRVDVVESYVIDWSDRLEGSAIAESTWHVPDGSALEVEAGSASATSHATGMRLSGGTRGIATRVVNRVTFADGRVLEGELDVYVG